MLEASSGSWTYNPTSYTYQWQDCNAAGSECSNILSATNPTYIVSAADSGHTIRVVVTATNSAGPGTATSMQTAAVDAPYNTTPPTISYAANTPIEGSQMSMSSVGTWLRSPTSFAYQWLDCSAAGEACAAIAGANGTAYTPTAGDVGHAIRLEVTAYSNEGSSKATSPPTPAVGLRPAPTTSNGTSTQLGATSSTPGGLSVNLILIPESRKALLLHGIALKASANQPADGVASIFISASEAKQAGIPYKRHASSVVVGRGTIKGLSTASGSFHLRLSKKVMVRLRQLRRVVLKVQLMALDARGQRQIVTVAGRY
jgi:hypothetical protein